MSLAPNLAAIEPLLIAAPAAAAVVAIIAFMVIRKLRAKKATAASWTSASHELGIDLIADGSSSGAVARGRVNEHIVTVAPASGKGRKARRTTQYSIKFDATEAPQFRLIKRLNGDFPTIDTGNPKFDAVVAIQTEQPELLSRFLTAPRRAAILRILSYWPDALISNREVHLTTPGIEKDTDALIDSVCHLVATAETFDRPTQRPNLEDGETIATDDMAGEPANDVAATTEPTFDVPTVDAPTIDPSVVDAPNVAAPTMPVAAFEESLVEAAPQEAVTPAADADVLTEVRLDELTVLNDLFNSGLAVDQIAGRFEQLYQGRDVSWSGEVVRVAPVDEQGRQRIAALVGSADGQTPESGRVVALTAVGAEPVLAEGDVVSFSGSLVNLDAAQRLFHVF